MVNYKVGDRVWLSKEEEDEDEEEEEGRGNRKSWQ